MEWLTAVHLEVSEDAIGAARRVLEAAACAFFEGGVGFTCESPQGPGGGTSDRAWVVGLDGHTPLCSLRVAPERLAEMGGWPWPPRGA